MKDSTPERGAPFVVDFDRWLDELRREEDDVSYRRRLIQGRLDILRAERAQRELGGHVGIRQLPAILSGKGLPAYEPVAVADTVDETAEPPLDPLEAFPDLRTLSEDCLVRMIQTLARAEALISRRRRILHARIDFLLLEQARSRRLQSAPKTA